MVTHNILQQNDIARTHLKEASRHLDDAVDRLRQTIIDNKMKKEAQAPQKVFKLKQLLAIIRKQYYSKKKEFDKTLAIQHKLRLKVISTNRAMEMAKNIFAKGDFKKLREKERLYNKQLQQFNVKLEQFNNRQAELVADVQLIQEKYYLTKQGIELSNLQRKLDDSKLKIENEQVRLTLLCDSYQAQNQIKLIAAGILRKNLKYVKQLEEITKHTDELRLNLRHIKKQIETVKEHIEKVKPNICFGYVESADQREEKPNDTVSIASLIADALNDEDYAVPLVGYIPENCLEMEKNWHMLSNMEKREILWKQFLREWL